MRQASIRRREMVYDCSHGKVRESASQCQLVASRLHILSDRVHFWSCAAQTALDLHCFWCDGDAAEQGAEKQQHQQAASSPVSSGTRAPHISLDDPELNIYLRYVASALLSVTMFEVNGLRFVELVARVSHA